VSDIDFLERKAEDPPWYKAFSQSVQQEAIAIFTAKKQLEQQRNELRTYIQYSMGQSAWDELLRIEAKVRKQRADHEHRKAEIKETIVSALLILVMVTSVTGFLTIVAWLWMENHQ
jgi:Flp pilus assembly protein TadB